MKLPLAVPAALLLAALASAAPFAPDHLPADVARPAVNPSSGGPEPPNAIVTGGEPAPDVSWQASDGTWLRLADVRAHGPVLLVFTRREIDLATLQRERDQLLDLGVLPVAVVDRRPGAAADLTRRLRLTYTVIPDRRCVVAQQFNAIDPDTRSLAPAWFMVDRRGVVRGMSHGELPSGGWSEIAAGALALPRPGATLPSSTR